MKVLKKYMIIKRLFQKSLIDHYKLGQAVFYDKQILNNFSYLCKTALLTLNRKKKIIFFVNGGSAADAQHIATELTVRFKKNRQAFNALAITTDTSCLTAIGNDFGFKKIFSRQLEAIGQKGDLVVAISTSGDSPNILDAINFCNKKKINTFGFLGKNGGKAAKLLKKKLIVPSYEISRIQEYHIFFGHLLCQYLEDNS